MIATIASSISSLTKPNELELESIPGSESTRVLPIGLGIRTWLNSLVLQGVLAGAIAVVVISYQVRLGELPITLVLLFDHKTAQGIVDNVHRTVKSKGKDGFETTQYEYDYHFALPNGNVQTGKSISSVGWVKKQAKVQVDYYPNRPKANRIQGMQADENNFFFMLALTMPIMSAYGVFVGFQKAKLTNKLLRFGVLGNAVVTHCEKIQSAGYTFELWMFKWLVKPKSTEVALADFQRIAIEEHRKQFNANGQFVGNASLRILYGFFAAFFGGMIFGIVGVINLAFRGGNFWIISVLVGIGAIVFAAVESRWHPFLRFLVGKKWDDPPVQFAKCRCIHELQTTEASPKIRIAKEMNWKGDALDFEPRPILYLRDPSGRAMLIEDLGGKLLTDSAGKTSVQTAAAWPNLLAFVSMLLLTLICSIAVFCL